MARRKFIYHHFVNSKEVTKEEFLKELEPYCMRCDTKLLQRRYDFYKCHPGTTRVYVSDNKSFNITREEIKK